MKVFVAFLLTLCLTPSLFAQTKIIFDTDMDTDCDDAGAMAVLHVLADQGEAEILATVVSSHYPWSVPCVEAINRYYGRADLPIGSPKSSWRDTGERGSRYAKQISEQFETRLKSNDDAPDAVEVYRRVLAAQLDGSVVVVTVGYLTNLRDLLASQPDKTSPLDGVALVRKKVKRWVCMGGRYPKSMEPGNWGNFRPDASSASIAVRDWPGQIFFTGLGERIHTGSRLSETPSSNPVRRIYQLYLGEKKTRPSWDHIGVLFAIRDQAEFWTIRSDGHNHVSETGTNQWIEGPETNHRLIELRPGMEKSLVKTLDEMMIEAPQHR